MSNSRMEQVELRIRYLLDYIWRGNRRGGGAPPTATWIPAAGDSSITGPIFLKFEKYMSELGAVETWFRYLVSYQRNVPR